MFGKLFQNKIIPHVSDNYLSPYESNNEDKVMKLHKFDSRKRSESWSKLSIQKKRRNTILKLHNENFMGKMSKESPIIRLK